LFINSLSSMIQANTSLSSFSCLPTYNSLGSAMSLVRLHLTNPRYYYASFFCFCFVFFFFFTFFFFVIIKPRRLCQCT
jgi:hypothetical protein